MEAEITGNLKLEVYRSVNNYIGKIVIPDPLVKENISHSKLGTIVVLDRSGSMGSTFFKLINRILPKVFNKLGYYENEPIINLVTFESKVEVYQTTVSGFSKLKISSQGETYMAPAMYKIEEIMTNWVSVHYTNYRILAISDGELNDQSSTVQAAEKIKEVIKRKNLNINAHAIRFFTSSDEPDTRGLSSIMQLNSISNSSLIDVTLGMSEEEIVEVIYPLFANDGLDTKIRLKSVNKENFFMKEPWSEPESKISLYPGENILWINEKIFEKVKHGNNDALIVKLINKKEEKVEIQDIDKLSYENYQQLISKKIDFYIQKLKVLKILNTKETVKEMEQIIQFFSVFESSLSANSSETQLLDKKISSRVQYLRNIIAKRSGTLQNLMNGIKNDEKITSLNSKQQADYLRSIESSDKTAKSLAKRANKEGTNFDEAAQLEVIEMSKHIHELDDIDDSNHAISFYSTCTTLDGIRTLSKMPTDPSSQEIFESLTVNDIIKLMNIVGIAAKGKINNYPDPMVYRLEKIYVGTFVSMSDIVTSLEVGGGKVLSEIGNPENEINNCVPYFENERIHQFLLKYCPKLLEYTASIGMRRIIAEIPYTWEYTYLAGIWKIIQLLIKDRTEINIKIFVNLINSYQIAAGNHFDYVLSLIKKQEIIDHECLSIYIGYNNINNMTSPILTLIKNCKDLKDRNMIQRILRATYQHEIYQYVRTLIRKQPNENRAKFISSFLGELLNIDYEKHKTPLPKLFEHNPNPKFYDEYEVNNQKFESFFKQASYADFISLVPKFFDCALSKNPVEEFKNLPSIEDLDKLIMESLGIDYDVKTFKLFCIVQSFLYKEKSERCDVNQKKMLIVDLGYYKKGVKMVKQYVKSCYSQYYSTELKKQKNEGVKVIMDKLITQMISCNSKDEFLHLLDTGLTVGNLNYMFFDESSKGFVELKSKLIDKNVDVPLRGYKLMCIITGQDDKNNIVWNKGNVLRDIEEFNPARELISEEEWKTIQLRYQKLKIHIYRELENRHGHSNNKISFWALGFNSVEQMLKALPKEEAEKYKSLHINCCGLNIINKYKSFKQIKREKQKALRNKKVYIVHKSHKKKKFK